VQVGIGTYSVSLFYFDTGHYVYYIVFWVLDSAALGAATGILILAFVLYIGQFFCIKTLRVPLFSLEKVLLSVYYCIITDCCKGKSHYINCLLIVAIYNFLHLWR